MKINDFNLVGITILGSRNGVKVEPGIENAELSVVDIMGKEFFEKQTNALRVAYEKLDNSKQDNEKEGESQMTIEEKEVSQFEENNEVCPECGENPCICEEHKENEEELPVEEKCEEEEQENKENCEDNQELPVEEKCEETEENTKEEFNDSELAMSDEEEEKDPEDDEEEDDDESDEKEEDPQEQEECGESHHMEETSVEEQPVEEQNFEENTQEIVHENESFDEDHVQCDMAWLLTTLTNNNFAFDDCRDYYKNYYEGEYKDFVIELVNNLYKINQENIITVSDFMQKIAENTLSEEDQKIESELSQFSFKELYNNYKDLEKKCSELESTVATYKKEKFMREATTMIDNVILPDDVRNTILNMCESGEISDLETLKTKVAVASFDFDTASASFVSTNEATFSAAVVTPNVTYKKEKSKEKVDKWEAIKNYTKK